MEFAVAIVLLMYRRMGLAVFSLKHEMATLILLYRWMELAVFSSKDEMATLLPFLLRDENETPHPADTHFESECVGEKQTTETGKIRGNAKIVKMIHLIAITSSDKKTKKEKGERAESIIGYSL